MTALFLSLALVWALDSVIDAGWAGLVVALLWGPRPPRCSSSAGPGCARSTPCPRRPYGPSRRTLDGHAI
ncbi:phage holin family protein [Herbidospora solisilvae]|uniref:phage holin family protein n=1 Tax=Herbidospora solisilvae TaxID=2696284 RepID=UPI0038B2F663